MGWQLPPLEACLGLLLISIGIVMGFDIRLKFGMQNDDSGS